LSVGDVPRRRLTRIACRRRRGVAHRRGPRLAVWRWSSMQPGHHRNHRRLPTPVPRRSCCTPWAPPPTPWPAHAPTTAWRGCEPRRPRLTWDAPRPRSSTAVPQTPADTTTQTCCVWRASGMPTPDPGDVIKRHSEFARPPEVFGGDRL